MGMYSTAPLLRYLRSQGGCARDFSPLEWRSLIRSARHGSLLSRISWLEKHSKAQNHASEAIQAHFESAQRVADTQRRNVLWEITQIHALFSPHNIPFLVLKGGAYILTGANAGCGRVLSDIDIMVHKEHLTEAERILILNGWFPGKLNPYDQKYYREWMHELPPLRHLERGTSLDVHHTILPPTARLKPNVERLWESASQVPEMLGVYALSPVDMILHSATHLFHDGELDHGIRDLVDIDSLIDEFRTQNTFWDELLRRATELDLEQPLRYALHCCHEFLSTDIPASVATLTQLSASERLTARILTQAMTSIFVELRSPHVKFAQFLAFVRAHYLRMPLRLLAPHLLRKLILPTPTN